MTDNRTSIAIYQDPDRSVRIEVRTDSETVWLNRQQMAVLFGRDVKTIGKHVATAQREELAGFSAVAKFATTAADGKVYNVEHYNLDVVLSVGYRVKSAEGVRFRRWANEVLRAYLVDGAAVNTRRLEQIGKTVQILARSTNEVVAGVASLLSRFSGGLDLLDAYDHDSLTPPRQQTATVWQLTYDDARHLIDQMGYAETSTLFGAERDGAFDASLGAVFQTFGGADVYPSVQEKAANLLYLVVKDHPFADGNKRIAAALFVYFLARNDALLDTHGQPLVDNNTLAATTLMIALSRPDEKTAMCLLVMNMLARNQV